ncbi:DNA photolyase family protein [bacterium]|nr:DNA photolyase family protein [bacterium]
MDQRPVIVWFRRDLRLADNPALAAAVTLKAPVLPVFIWAPDEDEPWPPGAASRWWLRRSLEALEGDLKRKGSGLVFRRGPSLDALLHLIKETNARAVYWNRLYEPAAIARDKKVEDALRQRGVEVKTFNAALLVEPDQLRTRTGGPYRVFTPFWKALANSMRDIHQSPSRPEFRFGVQTSVCPGLPDELGIDSGYAGAYEKYWKPGEASAHAVLKKFVSKKLENYHEGHDRPDLDATSRLSPHLHFGEISPQQVVGRLFEPTREPGVGSESRPTFLRQLAWREFAHHLLFHFPHTPTEPLRPEFKQFAWKMDQKKFEAWKDGRTGYPLVDAGMRQLRATGWMHNRVRMIAASFLVKDLMIPWQAGARHFWQTLVDADLANNTLGWQWVAGCGADAAPFFRIFNPIIQAKKFDPDEKYVRQWVQEYGTETYAKPIVDHRAAVIAAMRAYHAVARA